MKRLCTLLAATALAALFSLNPAGSAEPPGEFKALDQETQDLKQEILQLNRDLFILEEELLYPSSTQVAVFVSLECSRI